MKTPESGVQAVSTLRKTIFHALEITKDSTQIQKLSAGISPLPTCGDGPLRATHRLHRESGGVQGHRRAYQDGIIVFTEYRSAGGPPASKPGGHDGRAPAWPKFEMVILSVKAGNTGVAHVRDLRGVLDREKAAIGILISTQDHTKPMHDEAVTAGFYESQVWGKRYPKIQLFTVADLLAGRQIEMPPIRQVGATFKKAPRARAKAGTQGELPGTGA